MKTAELIEALREERQAKNIELSCGQVEQNGLPVIPSQPWQKIVDAEQEDDCRIAESVECAVDFTGVYFLGRLIK